MKLKQLCPLSILASVTVAHGAVIADNFENNNPSTDYNNGIAYGDNGGTGFGAISYLEGNGGGVFTGTLNGSQALGVFAGGGGGNTQGLGRTAISTTVGTYTINGRFDVSNTVAFSGFNIKSSLGTSFGGSSELVSFGLTPGTGNSSIYVGGLVATSIALGIELRGVDLDFKLDFDTNTGAYTLGAKRTVDTNFSFVSGTLKDTNGASAGFGPVAAVGFGNFNTGNSQNLLVDNLSIVPEPASAILGLLGTVLLLRRRK